ncbi:acyl-CoA dehydrogenase family protein [Mangrovitalea sediminis]|uniref:acyl-CoA dehydrogenase family protein n=1 Tax=Mangrovitalea sediminis TaxID=1982043 RepID=UPI000BE5E022|nr:acyl-CoA dehydrogenase family protein [Mangrovitalea sediminis]
MARDPIGLALATINRLAGAPWLDRFGLRKRAERLAFQGTRAGFHALAASSKGFKRARQLLPTQRLPGPSRQDLFDLSLSDEQQMIVDSLQRLAQEAIRPAAAIADEAGKLTPDLEAAINELGLIHYAVPAAFGGTAEHQSPVTSVLIGEQLAWGDMGIALAALSTLSVAQALTRWGSGHQQSRYLPEFCESDAEAPVATIAVDEPHPLFDPYHLHTRAHRTEHGFVLNGLKSSVVRASEARLLLVSADLENEGPRLFLVEPGAAGLACKPDPAMGVRAASTEQVALSDVALPEGALLGENDDFDYREFLDRSSLMRCALAIGCAQAVLDYVIPYCNEREAFGEPISHRQSVAFMISNIAIELDAMRLLTWRAASRAEQGLPFSRETALARLFCNEKAMEIGSQGVQLLGGHGFVKEHPVERWYRDLRSIAVLNGGLQA